MLLLPQARENLTYFHQFKNTEKMFATNGSSLTPKMIDLLAASGNRYVIHVSLHAANAALHARMAGAKTFNAVLSNLDYLRKVKSTVSTLRVNYIFVATTENIADLPAFVRFDADHGADAVVAYYNYVYRLDQKHLSCYFAQELTNAMIDQARAAAKACNLTIHLPPKFRQAEYSRETICGEVWSNLMVNTEGDIITCDVAGDSRENINGKSFDDVWNGEYYSRLRSMLKNGNQACSAACFRANHTVVNDFRSHFITRGKSPEEIEKFMEGT
jgi:MoaA/NifB/PqqE/SkfB family radical SAM enzyme